MICHFKYCVVRATVVRVFHPLSYFHYRQHHMPRPISEAKLSLACKPGWMEEHLGRRGPVSLGDFVWVGRPLNRTLMVQSPNRPYDGTVWTVWLVVCIMVDEIGKVRYKYTPYTTYLFHRWVINKYGKEWLQSVEANMLEYRLLPFSVGRPCTCQT